MPVDLATNAESLGAYVIRCTDIDSVKQALAKAKKQTGTTLIYVETDMFQGVDGYAWWEVPVAEVSEVDTVQKAFKNYQKEKKNQRYYL